MFMCEIKTKLSCPHCLSAKVVKNGQKAYKVQNFLCRNCKKQFLYSYQNNGANPSVKKLIVSMLLRNSGIRDIETILNVSRKCVLNTLVWQASKCEIVPKQSHYKSVQIDEHWSYVKEKKKQKRWLIYAYAPETKEVIGYVIGKRDTKTVKKLYEKLAKLQLDEICTDKGRLFLRYLQNKITKLAKNLLKI